ncbi:MAG: hypothetical protein ACP5IX_01160 [Patescibacteria group bacterium]
MPYSNDRGFGGGGFNRPPRQMYDVSALNIKCCDCGVEIKELPFNPDPNKSLDRIRCPECQRKFRMSNPRRGFGGRGFGGGGRRFGGDES